VSVYTDQNKNQYTFIIVIKLQSLQCTENLL